MKRLAACVLIVFATLAIAKTWGPFSVAAAGPEFARVTFESDIAYQAANRLASIYLSAALNTPTKIARAIRSDYVRVVYYDGQIYDYKIALWPSSAPLNDPAKMPSVDSPGRMSPADKSRWRSAEKSCKDGRNTIFSYNTGYWASSWSSTIDNIIVQTAAWIDTGTVYDRSFQDCRGK